MANLEVLMICELSRDHLGHNVAIHDDETVHGVLRGFRFFEHDGHVELSDTKGIQTTYKVPLDAEVSVVVND